VFRWQGHVLQRRSIGGIARNHGPETNQSHIKKRFAAHVQNMGGEPYA
jgi:hypothetical protein